MKLGFKLIEVDTGDQERLRIGSGQWIHYADITNFQKAFLADDIAVKDVSSVLISLRYLRDGVLIALSKRLNGDRGSERSNETLWIYMPKEINLSASDIHQVIEAAKYMLTDRSALRDPQAFEYYAPEALKRDYPFSAHPLRTGEMTGSDFAVINCQGISPAEIISKGFQNAYSNFGYIVLNQSGRTLIDAPHISLNSVKHQVWVKLPLVWPQNLQTNDIVKASINNITLPENGAYFEPGSYILTLSRQDYAPVQMRVEVHPHSNHFIFPPESVDHLGWYRKFDTRKLPFIRENGAPIPPGLALSSPDVYNEKGQICNNFKTGDIIYIPEHRFHNFNLSVVDSRYQRQDGSLDLTRPLPSIPLQQHQATVLIQGDINGNRIVVDIKGPDAHNIQQDGFYIRGNEIRKLPPGGFRSSPASQSSSAFNSLNNGFNSKNGPKDKKKKGKNKLAVILGILAGIFLIAAVVFLILYLTKNNSDENPEEIQQEQSYTSPKTYGENPLSKPVAPDVSDADKTPEGGTVDNDILAQEAVEYIDQPSSGKGLNVTIEKSELENNPYLQGLFDDLNNYNLDVIINVWGPKLSQSKNFQKIVEAAGKNQKHGWNPKQREHNPTYNKENDFQINIQNYTYWLDKDQSPLPSPKVTTPVAPPPTINPVPATPVKEQPQLKSKKNET